MVDESKAKGGRARAESLSPEKRKEIAQAAALERWDPSIPKAIYGGSDRTLNIGGAQIPCYVLEDERRVLSLAGMVSTLGMAWYGSKGPVGRRGNRLANFAASKSLESAIDAELRAGIDNPIRFKVPGGSVAYGFEAALLPKICEAVLAARHGGKLRPNQMHIARQCEIVLGALAKVGIIALVDEATGYQEKRTRDALEKILEKYISQELNKWAKTFPDEFYKQMFRLLGWPYDDKSIKKRPGLIGQYTSDFVYGRLAPGVLEELRSRSPKNPSGTRKARLHQWLTSDVGHPRLREHLEAVIALMRISTSIDQFKQFVDQAYPKQPQIAAGAFGADK